MHTSTWCELQWDKCEHARTHVLDKRTYLVDTRHLPNDGMESEGVDINPPRPGDAVEEAAAASNDPATNDDNFGTEGRLDR